MPDKKPDRYRNTLNLPKTDFPMKANLPEREQKILELWDKTGLYQQICQKSTGQPSFILHDGPPYANGHIHIGTALNKILKDFVVKTHTMSGKNAPFIPGWDCHGLPIELNVDKELGEGKKQFNTVEFRRRCREYANRFIEIQRNEFKRLGCLGEWNQPYITMDFEYEAVITRELGKMVKKGLIYRGLKPVFWCCSCQTALAEAEVEYHNLESPSIYVKFPISSQLPGLPKEIQGKKTSLAIWTTTPWTLLANLAVCLNPELDYVAVEVPEHGVLIMAEGLVLKAMTDTGIEKYEILGTVNPRQLEGEKALHPFLNRESLIILGEHVTLDAGTGCVHTAPGHGQEDYVVGQRYKLETFSPVDAEGKFTSEAGMFAGEKVFSTDRKVVEKLKETGALIHASTLTHAYPHCWRCLNPIVFRATPQWFINLDAAGLREKAMKEIHETKWIPTSGRERILGMVQNRTDWCISRQRLWGVPIPAFYCESCGHILLEEKIIEHIAGLYTEKGADIWFELSPSELLPPETRCPKCQGKVFRKENDILDVWFDSGISFAAVLEKRPELSFPADLYLEGSDQHRGWFQSSLLLSVATRERAPYRAVLTHGFVVDGEGKKMSKKLGNVILPEEVIQKYGAEILRLWVASEDFREDIRISPEILERLAESYRKIRNTFRFLLGNLQDFHPAEHSLPYSQLLEIDRYLLHRLSQLRSRILQSYQEYLYYPAFHALHNFCVVDLSSFYLDVLKDRLYTFPPHSPARRSAQTVIYLILEHLLRLSAPILSFTAEEAWQMLPPLPGREPSVHLALFPSPNPEWENPRLGERWQKLLQIRGEVLKALEQARRQQLIGNSLEAKVVLDAPVEIATFLKEYSDELRYLFITSMATIEKIPEGKAFISQEIPGLKILIVQAPGQKCERCWNFSERVGEHPDHPTLCERCLRAI